MSTFCQTLLQRFLIADRTTYKDVFLHMDHSHYQMSHKRYIFRARKCSHCISRTHLLCSVLLQRRNLRNSHAHFETETEKEKTDRMKRNKDTEGQYTEKAFIESVILVCSSTSLCYCAPIFRTRSLAGL